MFSLADWMVVAAYLAGIIAFGLWLGRDQRDTCDYFLGGRQIPWWGVGLSIVATETSALTFIGVPAIAFGSDLTFLQIIIGYVIARILLAIYMVPHYFKGEIYSPYQLFGQALGDGARRTAGGLFLISGSLAAGVRVYVTSIPIQLLLGVRIETAVLLFVCLSLVYTFVGGIRAVVWTDAVQFFLFIFGGLFTLLYVPALIDGGWSAAWQSAAAAGKLHWLNLDFGLALPPFNLWMGLIGATFLVLSSHGVDQLIVQRVLACKSVADGRKALALSAVVIFPMFWLFLLVGVLLWVYYQHAPPEIAIPERAGLSQNDYVFPIFMLTAAPPVVKGLLVVGVLSAAMSSVSSALSALASVSTMDFVRVWMRSERDERFYLWLSRWSTVAWAAVLVVIAWFSQQAVYVLNLAFSLNGLTNGALLGGLLIVLLWRKAGSRAVVFGMLTSLTVMAAVHFIPRSPLEEWWTERIGPVVGWPWYTLIGTFITLAATWLVRPFLRSSA